MKDLFLKVVNTIEKYEMICQGDSIVAGVSGGPDSMCMLHILLQLKDKYNLSLYAAHLNHQFRGKEAADDALYVKEICGEWGIPTFIKVFDVPAYAKETGLSSEEAGREIRYELYAEVIKKVGGQRIAVAHNMNDHIETILMNLLRGSGIEGLKGIEAVRGQIIRPLINAERDEIEEYCRINGISPRIDKTNLEPIYGRNKIRLELIPYIKNTFNPNIMSTLYRFSDIAVLENDYMDKEAEKSFFEVAESYENSIKYNINKLDNLHPALQRRVIRIGLEKLLGSLKGIEYKHIEEILRILHEKTGAAVMLPRNMRAYVSYENLVIGPKIEEPHDKYCYSLNLNRENTISSLGIVAVVKTLKAYEIADIKKDKYVAYIDKAKVQGDLFIRNRHEGDVFSPIGLKGSKKLKDYFIDEKIPKEDRDKIKLIADGKEIVWVIGKRLSEKYKITDKTEDVIMISIMRRLINEK